MGIIIKRNGIEHLNLNEINKRVVDSAVISQGMLTDDSIKISLSSVGVLDIKINDVVQIDGNEYRINYLPTVKKENNSSYKYEIIGEGLMFDLKRCKFLNSDNTGFKTTSNFPLIGNLELFLTTIKNNMHRFSNLWEIGNFDSTETKLITFGDDTCLSALQKICQEFKTDFWVKSENSKYEIHTGEFGSTVPIDFEYGKGNGLYNLSRKNVNENEVINRLYVNGGTENIPSSYRGYSDALKFSDLGYLEDISLINEIGLKEGSISFPEIYPKRTGTVTALGSTKFKFIDSSMDFDLNDKEADGKTTKWLIAGTSAKIHFNTGNLAGYEFEIKKGGYNHATKEFEIIQFDNKNGQKFPDTESVAFQINIGDTYVLLDIVMPPTYITNAETELLTKAEEQFELNKTAKVSYDLTIDPEYIRALPNNLGIGDYVRVLDSALNIDKIIRIQQINRNIVSNRTYNPFDYTITLADTYEINYGSKVILEVKDIKNVVNITNLGKINLSKLGHKTTEELKNLIFDTDGKFDTDNFRALSIEAGMISVGAQSQQLSCSVVFFVNENGNANSIRTKAGLVFSQTMERTWSIPELVQTVPDNDFRYVYAVCSKIGTSGNLFFTKNQIKFDEDPNSFYFLLGILHTVTDGVRVLSITIGSTTINGGLIRTGIISSLDGTTTFNLDTGEIKGKITFSSNSPAFQQINDSIKIGGRNLALNTSLENSNWTFPIYTSKPLTVGETYTLSFDYEGTLVGDVFLNESLRAPLNTNSKRAFATFVFVKNDYFGVELTAHAYGATSVSGVKLEVGNKASDWTPAPEDIKSEIGEVYYAINDLGNYIDGAFSDGIISQTEAIAIEKYLNQINTEKADVQNKYNLIFADSFLNGTPKTNLSTAWTSFNSAHASLILSINMAIADGATTLVEKADVDAKFLLYRNALAVLSTRFQEAIKAIETATVNAIQIGSRNLLIGASTGFIQWINEGWQIVDHKTISVVPSSYGFISNLITQNDDFVLSFNVIALNGLVRVHNSRGFDVPVILGKNVLKWTAENFRVVFYSSQGSATITEIKLEKGNKATDWTPAPEDIQAEIDAANIQIGISTKLLSDISNDNKLTPNEKQNLLTEVNNISREQPELIAQAQNVGVSVDNYLGYFNNILNYTNPLLADLNTTSDILATDFRWYFASYHANKTLLLKQISDKLAYKIDNIKIGGRNLVLDSTNLKNFLLYGVTGNVTNVADNNLSGSKIKIENIVRTVDNYVFYFPLMDAAFLSSSLLGKDFVATFFIKANTRQTFTDKGIVNEIDNSEFTKVVIKSNYQGGNLHIDLVGDNLSWVEIHSLKIEFGNQSTDWTAAPEDVDSEIAAANANAANALAQATNALNTAAATASVTSFLQTTVDNNVVSTGTMQVGDVNGANAGITGVTDRGGSSVRFWAGATYAGKNKANWLMKDDGMEEQWLSGILIRRRGVIGSNYYDELYNANGQLAKKTALIDGSIVEEWYKDGIMVYQIGGGGIYFVSEVPESFTIKKLLNLKSNVATNDYNYFNATILFSLWQRAKNPSIIELRGDFDSYLYASGQNVYSQSNKQYEGYKNNTNKMDNIANGWYCYEQLGSLPLTGNILYVQLVRVSGGRIVQNGVAQIDIQNHYIPNQF